MPISGRFGVHETFRSVTSADRLPGRIFQNVRNSMQPRCESPISFPEDTSRPYSEFEPTCLQAEYHNHPTGWGGNSPVIWTTRGLLAKDLVILIHGQVTRTTPKLDILVRIRYLGHWATAAHERHLEVLKKDSHDELQGDRDSLVVKVTDSWSTCHEFEPSIAEDPPSQGTDAR
ncbi:hypothetical protein TNCV_4275251 [Trichonephila clavipes]|nr:hypothetical protein TNCV_4275251 [Trichonephila clavipes]